MKYKKLIILSMIFFFSIVFSIKNVNATVIEEFNLDTNNCINGSCKVLNHGTVTIGEGYATNLNSVLTIGGNYNGSMYKVLDAYYDQSLNEVTYKFTPVFATFLQSSDDYRALTVDDYFSLTSDNPTDQNNLYDDNNGTEYYYYTSTITASTLNVLLSKYATYIKTNTISPDYTFSGLVDWNGHSIKKSCEAGAYLILSSNEKHTSGITVANVEIQAKNNEWAVTDPSVLIKQSENILESYLTYKNATNLNDFISEVANPNFNLTLSNDLAIAKNNGYSFATVFWYAEVPTNASNTVKNSDKLNRVEITFPIGIDYDLDNAYFVYLGGNEPILSSLTFDNGSCYINGNQKVADYILDGQQIVIRNIYKYENYTKDSIIIVFSNLQLNNNAVIGTEPIGGVLGNPIKTKYYYLKDAYANSEQTAFEEQNFTNTVYTYNLKINNKNNSDEPLNGAIFGIYTDLECTHQIAADLTMANGTVTFSGIGTGTYYLKQEKAASGYRIMETNPMEITLGTDDLVDDEYFEVTVTSPASLLLPFTGGSGTIIFTCFGFIAIVLSGVGVYLYTKKRKPVLEN